MSTTPTEILETVSAESASFSIESIKELMDGFDPTALLPELDGVFGKMEPICRVAVLAGPIVLLVLGLAYLLLSPKEANYYFGYRTYFGMGSVHAWRFTQRLAGCVLGGLGLVLTCVMVMISGNFARMETVDMLWTAITCLCWEAGLALLGTAVINLTAMIRFDRRGEYRRKNKKTK